MEELPRPDAARSVGERLGEWTAWFGLGRLVASAAAVVVVAAAAFWLTRTPQPPTEAALPRATVTESPTTSVLGVASSIEVADVTVHVTGAVVRPGVYVLPGDARVADAIEAAGGPSADGEPDVINLAAIVGDGDQIYVPAIGEEPPVAVTGAPPTPAGPVDVNRATVDELDMLPGVGPATASAIVTERERNGPFVTVDDLERVPGIGPVRLAALRDLVTT